MKLPFFSARTEAPTGRAVEVGWVLDAEKAGFMWDAPRRVTRDGPEPAHAKAVAYCPAVLDHESRFFEVPCPIDVNIEFRFDPEGRPAVVNLDGDQSAIRPSALNEMLVIVNRREWRHPDRPIIQFITPYVFVADEPLYLSQFPPFTSYTMNQWPGVFIGGRFPVHIWLRQMMWGFEWFDTTRPLSLRRGEPWFYVRFDATDPTRPIRLAEAEWTEEMREYQKGSSAVANYMNRTFSLFKVAESRRPKTLLKKKPRA